MNSKIFEYQTKIKKILEYFLKGRCSKQFEVYLEEFLNFFWRQTNTETNFSVLSLPIFTEWLIRAIAIWEKEKITPQSSISLFTLELAALLSQNETKFTVLNNNNFFIKLVNITKVKQPDSSSCIKSAYINLLSAFLDHKSGIEWITGSSFWQHIFKLSISEENDDIFTESSDFMTKLLNKTVSHDEDFTCDVIKRIVAPLREKLKSVKNSDFDSDLTLRLVGNVLEHILEEVLFGKENVRVAFFFLENLHIEDCISEFFEMTQTRGLVLHLAKIIFTLQFFKLYFDIKSRNLTGGEIQVAVQEIRKNLLICASKGCYYDILEFFTFGCLYWRVIELKIPLEINTDFFSLPNHFLRLQLIPNICLILRKYIPLREFRNSYENDECRTFYFSKFRQKYHPDLYRIGYSWRNYLMTCPEINQFCIKSMSLAKKARNYITQPDAVFLIQTVIYQLVDLTLAIKQQPQKLEPNDNNFFCYLLQLVTIFIEDFNITWKDNFDDVNILSTTYDFLTLTTWPTRVTTQALKLLNVSLTKSMSPNLALLVDETSNSTLALLGPLISIKFLDVSQVRLAALDVTYTMARISHRNNKISQYVFAMVSKSTEVKLKIERLLELLIKVKTWNKPLDKILDYFWQFESKDCTLIKFPIFAKWIKKAIAVWSTKEITPSTIIVVFTLNMASLLVKNEERFCELSSHNFFIKLINVLKARQNDEMAVKSAYIKLLSTFLEHKSGIELITACTFWEDVLKLSLSENSSDESTKFIIKLLEKTIEHDENFCNDVTKRIMASLGENIYNVLKSPNYSDDSIKPSLKLLGDILVYFLEEILLNQNDFRIVFLFLKNFHLEERIADFMIIAQSQSLVFPIAKIMFIMQFLELYLDVLTGNSNQEKTNSSFTRIKNNFLKNIAKGSFEDVMDFCNFGYLYWRVFESKISVNLEKNLHSFADHSNGLLLMPNAYLIANKCVSLKSVEELEDSDDLRSGSITNFFRKTDLDFIRVGSTWRRYLVTSPKLNQYCIKTLDYLKQSRKFLTNEGITFVFGAFFYVLKDIVVIVKESPEKLKFFEEEYFFKVFNLLVVFMKEFKITWKDLYEVSNIIDVSFDFVLLGKWSPKIVVEILKLINVAIEKCVSPNMALLMDRTSDSVLDLLGPFISSKLQEDEIKISGLEVIHTVTRMSRKFPSLQKVLMDSELPTLVVKMSTCDSESFVRATAIKCLQEMIQVEEIWNNALKSEDLPHKMRDVLLNETEGIVRVEAATFMCVAYDNQQFPKDTLDRVYETMIYSSTTDLHWEVKVRALDFWDKVIKNHLQNQGMIDGSFPNVTFSREHRKIVTLTDSEIRKRLLKVLSQLSSIGCLGVLMSAIKDDCDMEVSKTAVKITQRLVELFKKYNVRSDGSTPTSPLPTENGMSTASVSSGISVDESMDSPSNHHELNEEIINQIVNSKDVCLLKNVYAPSEYSSVSNYDIQVRKIVTPNEFLEFTQQDLNTIINEKKNWLNGIEDLGSLLDDMLKTYEDDVNNMDCY